MARELTYVIGAEYDGAKLIAFLRGKVGLSARLVQSLKALPDGICLNGSHIRTIDCIHGGDEVRLRLPEDLPAVEPRQGSLRIVYEDDDVLVIDKPPFLAMHPTHNHQGDTLANLVAGYLAMKGSPCAFRAVGRLDRDTSGLVVCALHPFAAAKLSGKVHKEYLAVARGLYTGRGTIDSPIIRPDPMHTRRAVGEGGERAVTHWQALCHDETCTLLQVSLETGRTHQIRVHFASLGTPLAGDTLYGEASSRISRQALHCTCAAFVHPVTGQEVAFQAPMPEDMENLTENMR